MWSSDIARSIHHSRRAITNSTPPSWRGDRSVLLSDPAHEDLAVKAYRRRLLLLFPLGLLALFIEKQRQAVIVSFRPSYGGPKVILAGEAADKYLREELEALPKAETVNLGGLESS